MAVKTKQKDIPEVSTTRYLPFSQIRENIVIMKDGSARLVMKCSTINFLLKNTDEQDSIIISFQRFLNSLDFPIQIIVRSTKLDIDGYLWKLNDKALKQKNALLQNQTYEYIEYLRKLIEVAQIMKKDFYIVIPFDQDDNNSVKDSSLIGSLKGAWSSIFDNHIDTLKIKSQMRNFQKMKKGLIGRSNSIKTGLENIGIHADPINKEDLIKFYTDYYNPSLNNLKTVKSDSNWYNFVQN